MILITRSGTVEFTNVYILKKISGRKPRSENRKCKTDTTKYHKCALDECFS